MQSRLTGQSTFFDYRTRLWRFCEISESTLCMLTRYNRWANQRIYEAIAALPGDEALKPPDEEERVRFSLREECARCALPS
jgi:hypothetical protein